MNLLAKGEGISKTGEILDLAVEKGLVEKSGAWYSYNNQRIGQGRENAKIFLKENQNTSDEIEKILRSDNKKQETEFEEDVVSNGEDIAEVKD